MKNVKFAVLTISDTCHQDSAKDKSGPRLIELLKENFIDPSIYYEILPDERFVIVEKLRNLSQGSDSKAVIFTTGGTGFAERDVTPEATRQVVDKECPQLTMALTMYSLKKTKFAALSRGVCGIANKTLILNFPGSEKAVVEYFDYIKDLLPHALALIDNNLQAVHNAHKVLQASTASVKDETHFSLHTCTHTERQSSYDLISYELALQIIKREIKQQDAIRTLLLDYKSPLNIPPFKAAIKDGYAMKSSGLSGIKKVVGSIRTGDPINTTAVQEDECFRINTGAPIPEHTDSVVQIEDTKLIKTKRNGEEELVEILIEPKAGLDIRAIGCDLKKNSFIFPSVDMSPVVIKSLMAAVGKKLDTMNPIIALVSTGNELLQPGTSGPLHKIYDSNTTLLTELLEYFGFKVYNSLVVDDDFDCLYNNFTQLYEKCDFILCTGGVSMGDRDFIKPVLQKMDFNIHFGRVNMKPGKPVTFASASNKYFLGLPGNPVSAFVTFYMLALPALRWWRGTPYEKCCMPVINVKLENDNIQLDARPEYMRATITSRNGEMFAHINGNQMSSRLQSIVGADVLVHMPAATNLHTFVRMGDILPASILRYDFITKYE